MEDKSNRKKENLKGENVDDKQAKTIDYKRNIKFKTRIKEQ